MTTDQCSISKVIADRFRDAIAKIEAEAARQISVHEAQVTAQFSEQSKAYQDQIAQLTESLEEATQTHTYEIKRLKTQTRRKLKEEEIRADEATDVIELEKAKIAKAISGQKRSLQEESDCLIAQIKADCDKRIRQANQKLKKETLRADEAAKLISAAKPRNTKAKAADTKNRPTKTQTDRAIAKIQSDCAKQIRETKKTCQGEIKQIKAQTKTNEQFYTQQLTLAEEDINKAIAMLELSQQSAR